MRYCLNFPIGGQAAHPRILAGLAAAGEEAGMRCVRIRLGTMVTSLARRRPWKLARETASIDHLSNGRHLVQ